jgi:two-component sensor histidine kinase
MKLLLLIFLTWSCSSSICTQITTKNQNRINELYPIAIDTQKTTGERLTAFRGCCWLSAYQDYYVSLKISSEFYSLALDKKVYDMQISALHYKGHSLMMLGHLDAANISFDEALTVAKEHNFNKMEAEAYGDLGNLWIKKGEVKQALSCHLRSDSIAKKHDFKIAKARAKINIGEIYETNGEYKKSLEAFREALKICEENGLGGFFSSIQDKLGDVNLSIEEYNIALGHYHLSYYYSIKLTNVGRQISSLKKLGEIHHDLDNLDSARIYFDKAIELSRRKMIPDLEAALLASLARVHLDQNSLERARRTIEESLVLFKSRETFEGRDNAFYIAGEIYYELDKTELTTQVLMECYALTIKSGDVFIREKACRLLATIYKETGNYRLSTNFYEEYLTLRDKRRGQEDVREILRLNIQNEYLEQAITDSIQQLNTIDRINLKYEQFKERERNKTNLIYIGITVLILILAFAIYALWIRRKRTRLLRHKNTVIEGALNDKEILLKEVHHRVKNNMQVVSSLLFLKSKSTESQAAKDVLVDSQKRIDSMLLAHQKMYRNNNFEEIEIVDYVNDIFRMLLESIRREHDSFSIVSDGKIFLQVEKAQALGFVIHELVTNSIKYAWPNQETTAKLIELEFMVSKESIGFTYLDNGVGIPDKIDITKINSFGLKMINSLVTKQLLGTIEIDGNRGLRVEIKLGKW